MSTPEMNHIEQIGKQIRPMGFKNGLFHWLSDVVNRICQTINKLTTIWLKALPIGIGFLIINFIGALYNK